MMRCLLPVALGGYFVKLRAAERIDSYYSNQRENAMFFLLGKTRLEVVSSLSSPRLSPVLYRPQRHLYAIMTTDDDNDYGR